MDINKERKLFQDFLIENFDFEHHEQTYFYEKTQCYENDHGEDTEVVNVAWEVWKAAKSQATPEGFVLVEASEFESLKSDNKHFTESCIDWTDRAYKQRAKVEFIKNEVERFKQSGTDLDLGKFLDNLIEFSTFKHDEEFEDFVLVRKELPENIAEDMAKERVSKPREENDPVWLEIAENSYKSQIMSKKWELWRDYKAMIEAQEQSHD
ncbi:hypothetical protein [Acinetobacter bereziniae]|uniref:hypothetical protein n=1 Tax=Acinetobacter bereziniae TaxID=106648 RepID=UPI00300862BA